MSDESGSSSSSGEEGREGGGEGGRRKVMVRILGQCRGKVASHILGIYVVLFELLV